MGEQFPETYSYVEPVSEMKAKCRPPKTCTGDSDGSLRGGKVTGVKDAQSR